MHQAKPSQAADGRQCQMYEKKNVLFRPKLCIWERCALSKVFKQSGCFAFLGRTDSPVSAGNKERTFQVCDILDN